MIIMKFNCDRSLLLNAVTIASRTVSPKSTIPALEGILFEANGRELTLTGYNLKTGIRTKIEADVVQEGRLVLNARLLGDIVRKMPEGIVCFESNPSLQSEMTCGLSFFEIMAIPADDFPELPSVEAQNSFHIQEMKLKSMISETLFAVSTNESRPVHTGSLFEIAGGELTVTSVDGYRLAQRREKLDENTEIETSFVVPGSALSETEKVSSECEDLATISLGNRHIMFSIGETEIISRRLEGEFLDYRKSIPKDSSYRITADRKTLLSSFERVSLMINEKYKSPVRCVFDDGNLQLSAITALGKATDECEIKGNANGLEIGFNSHYVLDALRAATEDTLQLQLNGPTSPCVIVPESNDKRFLYLILPVRLKTGG